MQLLAEVVEARRVAGMVTAVLVTASRASCPPTQAVLFLPSHSCRPAQCTSLFTIPPQTVERVRSSPSTAPSLPTFCDAPLRAHATHPHGAPRFPCISPQVERVRFSKDGSQLQLTAVDGRRALVVLPNDPELVDILARNGVDISGAWWPAF